MSLDDGVMRLAAMLERAESTLVLSGAGVLTSPDFPTTERPLARPDFEELVSIESWRRDPDLFWDL